MSEVKIKSLETQIEDMKKAVERRDLALRLANNPDFRKLILEGFCQVEAAAYVQSSTDPALDERSRADALGIAQASGHLKRWLQVIMAMGHQATITIADCEAAIEDIRAEEGEAE